MAPRALLGDSMFIAAGRLWAGLVITASAARKRSVVAR
jgi:hypothetical protein